MNLSAFSTFILVMALGAYQFYSTFMSHYGGIESVKTQVRQLQKELEHERLRTQLAESQTADLQQSVAAVIPDFLNKTKDHERVYGLRTLASAANPGSLDPVQVESATTLFERGRDLFRERQFAEANEIFSKIMDEHPLSRFVIESHFLYVEGCYQLRDFSNLIRVTEIMMARYPDHTLTGFALLRLARLYAESERAEDAVEVLQAVLRSYSDAELLTQAQRNLKEISL